MSARRAATGRCAGRMGLPTGLLLLLLSLAPNALAEIRVVATNPTLADLTRRVGGEQVRVESLMRGPENPHNVIPTPSLVMKLRRADLFVHLGLDAEPWVPNLLRSARREQLLAGAAGNVDASLGIELLEIPARSELTRAMGDIHVYGNTHYVLDPLNGIAIGHTISKALSRVEPEHASRFEARAQELEGALRTLTEKLIERMKPLSGARVVTYHRTWPYFLRRFALEKLAEVEPKPGIAPGPRHIARLAKEMEANDVRLVIVETFSDAKSAERLAALGGGRAVVLAQEVDAVPEVTTYEELFEYDVEALLAARRALSGSPTAPSAPPAPPAPPAAETAR
jgi:zinc/manganese transport system substrate-binding protein